MVQGHLAPENFAKELIPESSTANEATQAA